MHGLDCTCTQICKDRHARYERGRIHDLRNGRPRTVDGTGTRRRLQALMAIGWTAQQIAAAGGWGDSIPARNTVHKMIHQGKVRPVTAARARAAYKALSEHPGPSKINVARARAAGYLPPIAWDDDIDDPSARPWRTAPVDFDDAVVVRTLRALYAGEANAGLRMNRRERVEIARRWVAGGGSYRQLELRGWNPHRDVREQQAADQQALQEAG